MAADMYGRAHIVAVAGLPAVAAFGEEDASCLRAAVARTFVRPNDGTKIAMECEPWKANACPSSYSRIDMFFCFLMNVHSITRKATRARCYHL